MIPAGFAILTGLLLWAVIGSKGAWLPKLALIVLLPVFVWRVNIALDGYRGFPVQAQPPDNARLLAHAIEEPAGDEPGAIYVWLLVNDKPRAYQLPYSRSQHEELARAGEMQQQGRTVRLQRIPRNLYRPYELPPVSPGEKGTS